MRAGWAYFAAWPETAKDFAEMAKTKLPIPVLSIAGEKASAAILVPQMKLVATAVSAVDLKNTGHWLMEERPDETMKALIEFLWRGYWCDVRPTHALQGSRQRRTATA